MERYWIIATGQHPLEWKKFSTYEDALKAAKDTIILGHASMVFVLKQVAIVHGEPVVSVLE